MKAVFPGKPQANLHAVDSAKWEGRRLVTYISGNSLLVLGGPNDLLQTISHGKDEAFTAVAVCDVSGKIAACTADTVYVYRPFGQDDGELKWSLQHTLTTASCDSSITCLSWGVSEELLVGGISLTLFSTRDISTEMWSRNLANPTKFALLGPDASLIATTGRYDRLVKIWKRLWFGADGERFDVSYLPHPATVTGVRWHARPDSDYHTEAVLYTVCADNRLRIWAHTDPHGLQTLQLWAEIDMLECIEPRDMSSPSESNQRYVFIIDNWEFNALVERAAQLEEGHEDRKVARQHLMDVAYRDPDVCVILDDKGNMSAWGLERVGCKARQAKDVFPITQLQGLNIRFQPDADPTEDFLCCCSFAGQYTDCDFNLLLNFFDGRIEWLKVPIDQLFDASSRTDRLKTEAIWTGHSESIEKIVTAMDQSTLATVSIDGEVVGWNLEADVPGQTLVRRSSAKARDPVLRVCLVSGGTCAVFLHAGYASLWDIRGYRTTEIARLDYQCTDEILALSVLPIEDSNDGTYVALVKSTMNGTVWHLSMEGNRPVSLDHFTDFEVDETEQLKTLQPLPFSHGSQQVFVSVSRSGAACTWKAKLDISSKKLVWTRIAEITTGVSEPLLACASNSSKVALVDAAGTCLTIWDAKDSQIEFSDSFESHDTIRKLDWSTNSDGSSALAVGLAHKVVIYGQRRYDHLDHLPAWTKSREVDISELTNLYLADCSWLASGDLLLVVGNQMFLFGGDHLIPRDVATELQLAYRAPRVYDQHKIVSALNSCLPVWHPGVILQLMAIGKFDIIHRMLLELYKKLKFYSAGDELDVFLGLKNNVLHLDDVSSKHIDENEDESHIVDEDAASSLNESLRNNRLPHVSKSHQTRLSDIIESIGAVERYRRSVDDFGLRYLVFFHHRLIRLNRAEVGNDPLSWREIVWAYQSNSQDILVDFTSRQYQGKMVWANARDCGMFMWMTDLKALRAQFEVIARNEYTKTDEKNPIDCSLHYLALKKKAVLVGLWRMASWNREQQATQRLLANNFADQRWRTSALKNAYALLGRRRFEYAAAFFLLADHLKDAVGILYAQLGDLQLAIAVARVYEGDDGPVLMQLLEDKVLPQAVREGNRWMAHWAFSMLKKHRLALQCLVQPLASLVDNAPAPPQASRFFTNEDPALISLYVHLRDDTQATRLRGTTTSPVVSQQEEWDLVMRMARMYARAGSEVLALDLVRNWRFVAPSAPIPRQPTNGITADGVDEPNGVVTEEEETEKGYNEDGLNGSREAKRKKVVEEPSTSSIFDSFDF